MIALGVDVDDRAGALKEGLPDELLEADRLAGAEAAGEQAGRRAVLLAGLGEVEEDRGARAAQGVAEVGADRRAGVGDRLGDHRPDLVGQEMLLVLGQRKGGGRERGEEEAVLLAAGAVELDAAVGLAQALDPLLENLFLGGGDGKDQRRAQERRAIAAAEDAL